MDSGAPSGLVSIFAGFGTAPTEMDFDLKSLDTNGVDPSLVIPAPQMARTIYLMVVPVSLSGTDLNYTIGAGPVGFALSRIGLDQGGNTGKVTIPFWGSGFKTGLEAGLHTPSGDITAMSLLIQDSSLAQATFDLTGANPGLCDFVLSQEGQESRLNGVFRIVAGTGGKLETRILLPSLVRVGRAFRGSVEVVNAGDGDLLITPADPAGNKQQSGLDGEDGARARPKVSLQFLPISPEVQTAGVLRPGERYTFSFNTIVLTDRTATYQVLFKDGNSTDSVDWAGLESRILPNPLHPLWDVAWDSLVVEVGSTYGNYIRSLVQAANETIRYGFGTNLAEDLLTYMVRREMAFLSDLNVTGTLTLTGQDGYERIPLALVNTVTGQEFYTTSWYDGSVRFQERQFRYLYPPGKRAHPGDRRDPHRSGQRPINRDRCQPRAGRRACRQGDERPDRPGDFRDHY